jgi:hypothetical protein
MNKHTARAVLVGAALVLGVTAIVRAWFTGPGVSIGLWGIEAGGHGVRWDDAGADLDIYLAGYIAVVAALGGAVLAVMCALSPASSRVALARTVLTVAAVAMVVFILRLLAADLPAGVSWAAFLGPVAAITARQLVDKT